LSYTNFIVLRIYAEALDRLRVRLNMYLVSSVIFFSGIVEKIFRAKMAQPHRKKLVRTPMSEASQ